LHLLVNLRILKIVYMDLLVALKLIYVLIM
jgi:hypothetical protein